jgi:hypothetical protein
MKKCTKCGETKPLTEFYKQTHGKAGRHSYCKPCSRDSVRPASWRTQGIDPQRAAAVLRSHTGLCDVCGVDSPGVSKAWSVDHCHSTGVIRGVLCSACNRGLGAFNDRPEVLRKAAGYLDQHRATA